MALEKFFVAHKALLAFAKHCITTLQSCDCDLGAWQSVHIYDQVIALRSYDWHLQSSLPAFLENQWESRQGRFASCCHSHLWKLAERAASQGKLNPFRKMQKRS
uniref:Uncharacterized protein n=1 Tax=Micrurus paraensis TaxID=1970185 RepID=A0A2D4JZW1_9SAUR